MRIAELIKLNLSRCFTGDAFHLGRIFGEDAVPVGRGEESGGSRSSRTLSGRASVSSFNRDAEPELEQEPPGPGLCSQGKTALEILGIVLEMPKIM